MTWIRTISILSSAALLVGTAALRWSATHASADNWSPVHLPLPPPGITVSDTFTLAEGGRFELQIVTSATTAERGSLNREGPAVQMLANVVIADTHGFRTARDVMKVELSSWSAGSDIYTAREPILLPHRGEYQIELRRGPGAVLFVNRGAVVQLQRMAPSSYGLTYVVFDWVGYISVAAALAGMMFIALKAGPSRR